MNSLRLSSRLSSRLLALSLVWLLGSERSVGAEGGLGPAPRNLAKTATITSTSEQDEHPARNVADGHISPKGAAQGEVGSWAIVGDKAKGKADITFAWNQPTTLAEIVYFGRCSWQMEEIFKEYEVLVEGKEQPVASGEFKKAAGPQRVTFEPVTTSKLTIRFKSSFGGSNAGAAEIMIFAAPIAREQLDRLIQFAPNSLLSDHVVLQQRQPICIWGTAADGESVTVEMRGHKGEAIAKNGKWKVVLPPETPGDPAEIAIRSAAGEYVVRDVLIGEVWVASGQSNMEMPVDVRTWPSRYDGVVNAKKEIEAGDHPQIRMFYVPRIAEGAPRDDSGGQWRVCSPKTVGGFSAVAYFFARKLNQELKVPVGMIDCSWGATYIEPWTSLEGLRAVSELDDVTKRATDELEVYRKAVAANPETRPASHQHQATRLFNGMVHRLTPFRIRGAIWYQGEGNYGDGMRYYHKMRALIDGWREAWGQGQFPFAYAQLAPYKYGMYRGSKDPYKLPTFWEAQTTTLAVPNTGMAVITDIGDVENIHPPNKQLVGHRLALWALANTYDRKDLPFTGPRLRFSTIEPGQIKLTFATGDGALKSRDGQPLSWFTIAGTDKIFHPAEATIENDTIIVRSKLVPEPRHVRFAWHQLAQPNLCNEAGLPAIPFRTDSWTVQTGLEEKSPKGP